jgi:hypothetical protein
MPRGNAPSLCRTVRLYARALEIENEVEEMVADGDYMTVEELLACSHRSRRGTLDIDTEKAKAKAATLAQHKETKSKLGRLLGLGPEDINPLERSELDGPDDLRRRRARLSARAHHGSRDTVATRAARRICRPCLPSSRIQNRGSPGQIPDSAAAKQRLAEFRAPLVNAVSRKSLGSAPRSVRAQPGDLEAGAV